MVVSKPIPLERMLAYDPCYIRAGWVAASGESEKFDVPGSACDDGILAGKAATCFESSNNLCFVSHVVL